MTEKEWLEGTDPNEMLAWLIETEPSERKVRLFCCACCRRIWHLFMDDRCRNAVEVAERFADGLAFEGELEDAGELADEAAEEAEDADLPDFKKFALVGSSNAAAFAIDVNAKAAAEWAVFAVTGSSPVDDKDEEARRLATFRFEVRSQAQILRDIFGNPFRPYSLDDFSLTAEVVTLAQEIYDANDFKRLHLVANALEQAGCTDQVILRHCRDTGPHVRGCWALDAILGAKRQCIAQP